MRAVAILLIVFILSVSVHSVSREIPQTFVHLGLYTIAQLQFVSK